MDTGKKPTSTCPVHQNSMIALQRMETEAVREVAMKPVLTCGPNDDVHEALETMRQHQVRRVPVVGEDGKLAGILCLDEIVLHAEKATAAGISYEMRRPRLAVALLQILVQRSIDFVQRIESFSVDNIARRLARTLIRFWERFGHRISCTASTLKFVNVAPPGWLDDSSSVVHGSIRAAGLSLEYGFVATMKDCGLMCAGSIAQIRVLACALWLCACAQDFAATERSATPQASQLVQSSAPTGSASASERLPELPPVNTADFLPAIRTQIEQAEREARLYPRDPNAAGALAMTLHAYDQYDAAGRIYTRLHLLEPQNFDWLYLLGTVQMAKGAFDLAVESFQSALRIRPNDLVTELRLAEGLTAIAKWDEARLVCQHVSAEHPDNPQGWYGLGRVQTAKGNHTGAAESYAKACQLFPEYGAAHFALAGALRRLGRQAEAESHMAVYSKNITNAPPLNDLLLQRVHELNHSVTVHIQRGAELEKAGKIEEAIREHETALATDPDNVQARVNLITLYGRIGEAARAKQQFEAATKLNAGRSDAWYNYGVLLFGERDYAGAEQAFRRALTINPYYAEAHNNLGAIYEQQGRPDEAAGEFREAIANHPDYPLARFHLGRILVNQQKYDEAIQQFLRALQPETEQTPVYIYSIGATYARAGDRQHALQYFQKAHDAAAAQGQSQLLTTIDRDLKMLESQR
jgi:tetratricopeptide (TPR) repeat protein